MTFRLRPQAEADIDSILMHIAEDSPKAALRWYDEILDRCRKLGDMPGMGRARPEIRPDLRTFPYGNDLILYRQIEEGAEIVRIVYGARQWEDLL